MNETELRAAIAYLDDCLRALTTDNEGHVRSLSDTEQTDFDAGLAMRQGYAADLARMEQVRSLVAVGAGTPGDDRSGTPTRTGDDPFDLTTIRSCTDDDLRARALTAIETIDGLEDHQRAAATLVMERAGGVRGTVARHILSTGSDDYRSGWFKHTFGAGHLTDGERAALEAARAMSLTDANGGYAVPFSLDPTIIDTGTGSTNPFRAISTIRQTTSDSWNGLASAGMTVSWDGEAAEVSDDSPTLGPVPIPVHKAQGFAQFSIEIQQDYRGMEADLRQMIQQSKDDAEAIVFATGNGTNKPTGIVTALAGTGSIVAPTTAETFAVADLYKLETALPAKYRGSVLPNQPTRASWVANKQVYQWVRQFGTSDSHALWTRLEAAQPERLIGYSAYEASAMDGTLDAAATAAHNYLLVLGDFKNYVIVDRIGLTIEYVPHVFGPNGRPTGQRGIYVYWRVGGDSVNDDAFRMLDIPTTA